MVLKPLHEKSVLFSEKAKLLLIETLVYIGLVWKRNSAFMDPEKKPTLLTQNRGNNRHLATWKSDKRTEEENMKFTEATFLLLKYANQTSTITVTGKSAYLERIQVCAENNIMHTATYFLGRRVRTSLISKDFPPTDWLSKISKEVQPLLLSASKDRLKGKDNNTLYTRNSELQTSLLFTIVENMTINVLLDTGLTNVHVLAIPPNEQNALVGTSTQVAIVEPRDLSNTAVHTKQSLQNANIKVYFEVNDDQRSTVDLSNTVLVTKQEFVERLAVTIYMGITKSKGLLQSFSIPDHTTKACLPAKVILKAICNRSFLILVSNRTTKKKHFDKHKIVRRLNDDINTVVSTEAP